MMFREIKLFLMQHIDCGEYSHLVTMVIILLGIAVAAALSYYVCKGLLYMAEWMIEKSPTKWDDDLIDRHFMRGVSQLAPALLVNWLLPALFSAKEQDEVQWVSDLTSLYILWVIVRILNIFIGNVYQAFSKRKRFRPYAVKGIFQMLKLVVIAAGIIITVSILLGKQPMVILTALGASAAVLMLVFKDTILGLVASVQLTANKMLHRGDWIVMPRHDVNGEVLDVSLTTVKIRNWDNSVTTIPPYVLVSDSFSNYEPMRQSGGRRVDRSIYIDINTVGFCTEERIDRLRTAGRLEGVSDLRAAETVNLSLFRNYLERWLAAHPDVNEDMLLMVRQMEPTQAGLPLQLYFFLRTTEWKAFERVQSDIFDHVYAVIREFGLAIYQRPAGTDIIEASHPVARIENR